MITKEKIDVYKLFKGNVNGFARIGTSAQKQTMNTKDWYLIDELIQDIRLVKKGLTSEIYSKSIDEKLIENCEDESTIVILKEMA